MRKKPNFLERIKIAMNVFKITKNVVMARCNVCDCVDLDFETIMDSRLHYSSEYKCKRCGATCRQFEYWEEKGDVGLHE